MDNDAKKEQSCRVTLVCFDSSGKISATYFSREMSNHLLQELEVPLSSLCISRLCPSCVMRDVKRRNTWEWLGLMRIKAEWQGTRVRKEKTETEDAFFLVVFFFFACLDLMLRKNVVVSVLTCFCYFLLFKVRLGLNNIKWKHHSKSLLKLQLCTIFLSVSSGFMHSLSI